MTRQAECQRRYRQRQRAGEIVAHVPIGPPVIEALLAAGRLDDAGSRDPARVSAELAGVLQQWARLWLGK